LRFFLAGIMQGSHFGDAMHPQSYRNRLAETLAAAFPQAEIYDPFAGHSDSLSYSAEAARGVFLRHNEMCGEVDVVVAFVPEASMGTAIEMWEAFRNGRVVLCISPLSKNWVVKFCSHARWDDLDEFIADVASGVVAERIAEIVAARESTAAS
jgi:hypothetical protein